MLSAHRPHSLRSGGCSLRQSPHVNCGEGSLSLTPEFEATVTRRTALLNQLVARKSIDKLIRESEDPEHALKKSLGPWSLTALGIGAVIGSGIFTVIGTAMAGQKFDTPSVSATPL